MNESYEANKDLSKENIDTTHQSLHYNCKEVNIQDWLCHTCSSGTFLYM